jgi:hypothetical protein
MTDSKKQTTLIDDHRYAGIVKDAPSGFEPFKDDTFLIARQGTLSQYWCPSGHISRNARIAIVGITPGHEQATNIFRAFQKSLIAGHDIADALRTAKLAGSFSGPMRVNLVRMLDFIGLPKKLGIPTCASLFEPANELAHFTSALRYPVFVRGKNYNGNPPMLRVDLLRYSIETYLAAEASSLTNVVWLPLGPKPMLALTHLASMGVIDPKKILEGMPHPSGANAERIAFFLRKKSKVDLSPVTKPEPIEAARKILIERVRRLS